MATVAIKSIGAGSQIILNITALFYRQLPGQERLPVSLFFRLC